jgi:hypothetical protein
VIRARIVLVNELRTGAGAWCVQSTRERRARRRARIALYRGPTTRRSRTAVCAHAADTSATILARTYAENVNLSQVNRHRLIAHVRFGAPTCLQCVQPSRVNEAPFDVEWCREPARAQSWDDGARANLCGERKLIRDQATASDRTRAGACEEFIVHRRTNLKRRPWCHCVTNLRTE